MTSPASPALADGRRPDLDWIRVGAFFLLILYHVGMFYVPWDWHVKSPHTVPALEPIMQLTNPWRLTLLFLVSGAATRFMADKISAGGLAGARTARLLPPLIFAMFVIVPPQSYFEILEKAPQLLGAPADFYVKYATASGHWCRGDDCLITPTWNHMWFVAYLFVYSLILAAIIAVARKPLMALSAKVEGWLDGWALLIAPIVVFAVLRTTLFPIFDITHDLVEDWYNHALSFSVFMLGFMVAKSDRLKARFIALRWPALILAVAAYAVWATYMWTYRADGVTPPEALKLAMRCVYAVDQWCAIAAILGFGARHLTRGGPVLSYLTMGVFPFYIVHQTLIVVVAHYLAKAALPQALEAAILIATTFAGCLLTYEIVRRVNVLRPLFGLKWNAPKAAPDLRLAEEPR